LRQFIDTILSKQASYGGYASIADLCRNSHARATAHCSELKYSELAAELANPILCKKNWQTAAHGNSGCGNSYDEQRSRSSSKHDSDIEQALANPSC